MDSYSLYFEINRKQWAELQEQTTPSIDQAEFERRKGFHDPIPYQEVRDIYIPLSRYIRVQAEAARQLHATSADFLKQSGEKVPFVIGIAGSVAVGKSTTARLLQTLLSREEGSPKVELITTDGFLFPNHILEQRGLMKRKGFPESYDTKKLVKCIRSIKSGKPNVVVPVYSHLAYDIVDDDAFVVNTPDILIVEGINVLQVTKDGKVFVSDFFDFSIYVDAEEADIERWYVDRFLKLRDTAFRNPESYFHRYASLSEEEAVHTASSIWSEINGINLRENIQPTKGRAKLVLRKGPDHAIEKLFIRK
ncbi:type I pantothenate kinase [Paenibacillus sp. YYML68]|uniref:type I pantothenate kinase n=1 Tax=Paenibacillus sp. YYML68 TaxID=2909250 RepID=UPI002490E030|nr:type I pantothenate kinase [Paenibacillus sp. YYML68]